jgi:hypothetical protein
VVPGSRPSALTSQRWIWPALATTGGRPAGPPPLPPAEPGTALEIDRTVGRGGIISLANRPLLAAEILAGRRVSIRIEPATLMFFDPDTRELLRTRPNPLSWEQVRKLRGARPAGPPPRPSIEPVTVHRRASNSGVIMVVGQKTALGRTHAHHELTVHVAEHTITVELDDGGHRTFRRTTTQPVRKPQGPKTTEYLNFLAPTSSNTRDRNGRVGLCSERCFRPDTPGCGPVGWAL